MPDAYASFAVEFEADLSRVQAGMAQGISWGRVYGEGMASSFAEGFSSVSGAINMLQGIKGQFASVGQGLSEIFGMKAGSEMAYFRRQLTGMTGDAQKAQGMLDGLVKIANTTAFDNNDIFQLATNALGSGTKAEDLLPQVSNIGDAAAAMGIRDMAVFRRFSRNLFDIRGKEGEANQRDVNELYRQAPQFVFQAAKAMGTNVADARQQIQGMSGQDLFNLIEQVGKGNKGAAAAMGLVDPFIAAANAATTFATAMAPTGDLVNRLITPVFGALGKMAGEFNAVNLSGGGIPGLLLALGTIRGGFILYSATMGRSSIALNALAISAGRASLALNGLAGRSITGGISTAATGSKGVMPGALGKLPLTAFDWGAMALTAGFSGAAALNNNDIGKWIPKGLTFGGGGQLFEVFKSIDMLTGGKASEALGMESAAKDLKEAAKDLKDATADGYGYGKRGKHIMSTIEAGYALMGAERLGVA
jgi:hypothetical protein